MLEFFVQVLYLEEFTQRLSRAEGEYMGKHIFVINTGSTSTKAALFEDDEILVKEELSYDAAEISKYERALDQLEVRKRSIYAFLEKHGIDPKMFDIIVAGRHTAAG